MSDLRTWAAISIGLIAAGTALIYLAHRLNAPKGDRS